MRKFASTLRLTPVDTSTPEGRSKERHRRAFLTGASALIAKVVAVSTSLLTIPMALHYLGTERFGLWMTISSVIAILGFADFGIGNGVLNAVADAYGKEDIESIRRSVASAFALLAGIAALLIVAFSLIYPFVAWGHFFNVSSVTARQEAGPATAVFFGCFVANLPGDIVQRLQLGLQDGFISKLWQLTGSVAGLVGVVVVIHLRLGLPWLVGALAGTPLLVTIANNIAFFGWMRPDLRPEFKLISTTMMTRIAKLGLLFFTLQAAAAIAYSSDNFIVAKLLGPEAVTRYSITAKLFSFISLGLAMFIGPLWPAYGEAVSRGDVFWVKRTLIKGTVAAASIAALASAVVICAAPAILKAWVHQPIAPPFLLLLGLGLWSVLDATGQSVAMFLNGANVITAQVVISTIFALGCLVLKIFFVHRFGIAGVPWATFLSYAFLNGLPFAIIVPRIIASLKANSHRSHTSDVLYEIQQEHEEGGALIV